MERNIFISNFDFFISLLPYTLKNHYKPTALNFDDLDSISILLQNNRILALASRDSLFKLIIKLGE